MLLLTLPSLHWRLHQSISGRHDPHGAAQQSCLPHRGKEGSIDQLAQQVWSYAEERKEGQEF